MFMEPGHLKPCLFPAFTPLLFSGEPTLKLGELLLALGQVLMVWVFHTIGGDSKRLNPHVKTYSRSGRGHRLYLYIGAAQGDEILPAGTTGYRGRKYAPFDIFGDTALHLAQLRELYGFVQNLDVRPNAFALVALPMVMLALEPWIAGFLAPLYTAEKVLICGVQVLKRGLQGCGIHFLEPREFLLECC